MQSTLKTYYLLLGSEATCLEDHYIFADLYNKIFSSIENPAGRYDTTARFRDLIHFVTHVNGVNNQLEYYLLILLLVVNSNEAMCKHIALLTVLCRAHRR
jgi:hypothetical protein